MRAINFFCFKFFFAALLSWAAPAIGQDAPQPREERVETARESVRALKQGTLIVRLPSYQTKIDGLKDVLSSAGPDSPNRKRIEKQLEQTLADRQEFNQNIMEAFREAYNFSEVHFMLDTATATLKTGQLQGYFLNDNLETDPAIQLEGPIPYFILRFGSTSNMTTDGLEAMVVMNDRFQDMYKPFPYYQRLNDFAAVMGSIFPAPDQKKKDALRIVGKLNAKLHDFYQEARLVVDGS